MNQLKDLTTDTDIDKSQWRDGIWKTEPDYMRWTDHATDYPCIIRRQHLGFLCGYVGVKNDHPLFNQNYGDLDISVHGGLTFSDVIPNEDPAIWWFGFDCAHFNDYIPNTFDGIFSRSDAIYRSIDWVQAECESLATQLKALQVEK